MKWIRDQMLSCTGAKDEGELKELFADGAAKIIPSLKKMETTQEGGADDEEESERDGQSYGEGESYWESFKNYASGAYSSASQYARRKIWGNSRGGYQEIGGGNYKGKTSNTSGGGVSYQSGEVITLGGDINFPEELKKEVGEYVIGSDSEGEEETGVKTGVLINLDDLDDVDSEDMDEYLNKLSSAEKNGIV